MTSHYAQAHRSEATTKQTENHKQYTPGLFTPVGGCGVDVGKEGGMKSG